MNIVLNSLGIYHKLVFNQNNNRANLIFYLTYNLILNNMITNPAWSIYIIVSSAIIILFMIAICHICGSQNPKLALVGFFALMCLGFSVIVFNDKAPPGTIPNWHLRNHTTLGVVVPNNIPIINPPEINTHNIKHHRIMWSSRVPNSKNSVVDAILCRSKCR